MNTPVPSSFSAQDGCAHGYEDALMLYVDGELPFDEQAALFAHLARCAHCRRMLDSVLRFRRMLREETISVPPAVDDAFFERLAEHKRVTEEEPERAPDRPSVWRARLPVSWGVAAVIAAMLFLLGIMVPVDAPFETDGSRWVYGEEELVDLNTPEDFFTAAHTIYVWVPGVTVEAMKSEEPASGEAL